MHWDWQLIRQGLVVGFLLAFFVGCFSTPMDGVKAGSSKVERHVIKDFGCGLPESAGFKRGFVLCAGPWEGQEVLIVDGDELQMAWRWDVDRDWPRWKYACKRLTEVEKKEIQGYLDRLKGHLGFHYVEPRGADGLVLSLYETPDGVGTPVLGSSNARIGDLDGLYRYLRKLGLDHEALREGLDDEADQVIKRVMEGG